MINNLRRILVEGIFGLLGKLPIKVRLFCGALLNLLTPIFLKRRIGIARTNLNICFPDVTTAQKEQWLKQHFRALSQSIIDRGLLWYGSPETIKQQVSLENYHIIEELLEQHKPILLLAPHFLGLDVGATRLTLELTKSATIYTQQHDPVMDEIMFKGRSRFHVVNLINRKDGVRGMLRYLKQGVPVYYLPDMDFGRKGSIFVPFFGTLAATLPTTAHLAQSWHASVVPIITFWDEHSGHYRVQVLTPFENFPGDQSIEEATATVNVKLEQWIMQNPSQYYWVHRRFKTRPDPSDKKFY